MIMFVDANFGGCARHQGTSGKPPSLEDIERMDEAKAKAEFIKWVADIMTKPLHEPTFKKLRGWLRGTDWPEAGSGPHVCFD